MQKLGATDLYLFRSDEAGRADDVTIVANCQPLQDPCGGPNYFAIDANALTVGGKQVAIPLIQAAPQALQPAAEPGFDRAQRPLQVGGQVAVAHAVMVGEHERLAFRRAQLAEADPHPAGVSTAIERVLGRGRSVVAAVDDCLDVVADRFDPRPLGAADHVHRPVPRDRH